MAYSEKARQYTFDILESRRLSAAVKIQEYRDMLSKEHLEIAKYDEEINALGISLARASIMGDFDIKSIQTAINKIQKQKTSYMKQHKLEINPSFYSCPLCEDTGFIDGELCECAKRMMVEYTQNEINKISPLSLSNFSNFTLEYYPTYPDEEHNNENSRENMQDVYNHCIEFTRRFPDCSSLLMMGDAGLGKTHLALAIANDIIRRGYNVIYCSAANIFRVIENEYFTGSSTSETASAIKSCELLILDDLGAEYMSPFVSSTIYDIVYSRLNNDLPSIYTTNYTNEQFFEKRYTEKVSSRLMGCCTLLSFFGKDIREIKKEENQ